MQWNLVENEKDWQRHLAGVCGKADITEPENAEIEGRPPSFPCLVSSIVLTLDDDDDRTQIISAIVTKVDARTLLVTGDQALATGDQALVPRAIAESAAAMEAYEAAPAADQADFNDWAASHILALVKLCIDTGIIDKEGYVRRVISQQSVVEQHRAELQTNDFVRRMPGKG